MPVDQQANKEGYCFCKRGFRKPRWNKKENQARRIF